MSTFVLGGRAGWHAAPDSQLGDDAVLRANDEREYRSLAFDSGIARCRWDALRFDVALEAGARIAFSAYAADADRGADAIAHLGGDELARCGSVSGPFEGSSDALLATPRGRFLWLRVRLSGTPHATAELRALRVDFPRDTTLRMLPAVWSTDGGGRDLNERFLALFDAVRGGVLHEVRTLAAAIDPRTADASDKRDFLDWLGGWFGLEIFRAWPEANRRAVIAHAGELFRSRGTARGIRRFVELALGRDIVVLEAWQNRHWWFAAHRRLGCAVLFGPEIVGRAALGGAQALGTAQLASNPAPARDPFASRANGMTVIVKGREPLDAAALAMLRAVIDAQKPAHAAATVVAIESDLRLGVTAHLGLDAFLGALRPPAILAGSAPRRLGVNATLGGRP